MFQDQPIKNLPFTRPATIKSFLSLGIKTFFDLLNYFPYRYENYSLISPINRLQPGEKATVRGRVAAMKFGITKRGLRTQEIILEDESGQTKLVWYNQPYLLRIFKPGTYLSVSGEVKWFGRERQLLPIEYEILKSINQTTLHTGRIVPVYSEKRGLSSKTIREKISFVLDRSGKEINESLPKEILTKYSLLDEPSAYQNIHFPESLKLAETARQRLAFDELFVIQLSSALIKKEWKKETVGTKFVSNEKMEISINQLIDTLPFKLTSSQNKVWSVIKSDLLKSVPMNRFLQGDVGSGKTVVAALAAYLAFLNKTQTLFMAPTEILAEQHYQTINNLFKQNVIAVSSSDHVIVNNLVKSKQMSLRGNKTTEAISSNVLSKNLTGLLLPLSGIAMTVALVTGSKTINNPQSTINNSDIIIGTHALISKKIKFDKVGLVIIDEQHRFGVKQRLLLKDKGINPHLLTMTATPIPRTVALTLYGELDLSAIDEMPTGRIPVKTYLVPAVKRADCYQWIKDQIKTDKVQVFIVCPLIEESEAETMASVKAVKKEYEHLKNKVFNNLKLGLLHGRLKISEKNKLMSEFTRGKIDILISTPVVEVGIDIPNATVMIIEAAERYGLAQLHQLRGRVGRGGQQSYCFVFTEKTDEKIINRLSYFTRNSSGRKLAEYDLKMRGPGEVFGIKQHGYLDLKIASLSDFELIGKTRNAVNDFINKYSSLKNFEALEGKIKQLNLKRTSED